MTRVAPALPPEAARAPAARLGAALAASLLLHGWLLSALSIVSPWPAVDLHPGEAPIAVRITPAPAVPLDAPDPERNRGESRFSGSGGETSARKIEPGPLVSDPHYYPAQELDGYPRLIAPLRFGRPTGRGAVEVLLEILIDERGAVQEVIVARSARPGPVEEELRALLAATRFSPARKDGRVVRSRIVLRVSLDSADGAR